MYKTEAEISNQHISLRQTYAYMQGNAEMIKDFYGISGFYSVTFTGSGSMFSLGKSAELSLKTRGGLHSMTFAAGDLTLNMPYYRDMLSGTMMMALSRSGSSSEVIQAVEHARRDAGASVIVITATKDSKLAQSADLVLEAPWAIDEAITPTRSMSNFYLMNLYNIGLLTGDNKLLDELKNATDDQEDFIEKYRNELEGISQSGLWDKVLILADGELAGLAEASANAMLRMGGIPATHCNILNVRHGQHMMVDNRTLVITVVSPLEEAYQSVLLRELRGRGAQIMTISSRRDNIYGADLNVPLPEYQNYAVRGLPLVYCLQAIAVYKTIADGHDPDTYGGSDRWVRL